MLWLVGGAALAVVIVIPGLIIAAIKRGARR